MAIDDGGRQNSEGRIWAKMGPDAANIESNYLTGDVDIKRATYGAEAVFGLQWEFVRNFHLGLAVRTPRLVAYERVRHYEVVTRGVKLDDGHYSIDIDTHEDDDSASTRRGRTAPMNVVLGVAYALPRDLGWLSVEGDYSPALQHLRNDVDLRHTVNGRVGARIRVGETLIVGLGGFTDRANQTGVQSFPQFNISYYGGSMGLEFRRKIKLGAHERARDIQFLTALAVRYAFGTGQSGTVAFDAKRGLKWPIVREYGSVDPVQFHVLGAHIGAGLYF